MYDLDQKNLINKTVDKLRNKMVENFSSLK